MSHIFGFSFFISTLTSWVTLWRLKSTYFCRSPVPRWRLKSSFVKYLPIVPLARVGPLIHLFLPQSKGWGDRRETVFSVTWCLHLVTWSHSDHVVHLFPPLYAYRLTTHNTALIDLHVLWPIRLGLPAFFKWKYLYKPLYFFNHHDILYQY